MLYNYASSLSAVFPRESLKPKALLQMAQGVAVVFKKWPFGEERLTKALLYL